MTTFRIKLKLKCCKPNGNSPPVEHGQTFDIKDLLREQNGHGTDLNCIPPREIKGKECTSCSHKTVYTGPANSKLALKMFLREHQGYLSTLHYSSDLRLYVCSAIRLTLVTFCTVNTNTSLPVSFKMYRTIPWSACFCQELIAVEY